MKVAVIIGNPNKNFLARLTSIFTKCPAYHVGFLDEETNLFYDMYWLRRRRMWPRYPDQQVKLYDIPWVTREYLEQRLTNDDSAYGVVDYIMFGLRPLFHLFGATTRNAAGVICSEMLNSDIWACGGNTPFPADSVPSPCQIYWWLESRDFS